MEAKEKVIELLKSDKNSGIDFDNLKEDRSLKDQGLDSLGKMTLFFNIEEVFEVEISDDEVDSVDSIIGIIELINKKKN